MTSKSSKQLSNASLKQGSTAQQPAATLQKPSNNTLSTPFIVLNKVEEKKSSEIAAEPQSSGATIVTTLSSCSDAANPVLSARTTNHGKFPERRSSKTLMSARASQQKVSLKKSTTTLNKPVSEVFKQRLVQFRRTISKNMVFQDQLEMRDP